MTPWKSYEFWQQVSPVSYNNRWVLWDITTGESPFSQLNVHWMHTECSRPLGVLNPGILFLVFIKPLCYLYATLLHIGYWLIWIVICIHFFVLNVLLNSFIIDAIFMDSFLCMHHVGFNNLDSLHFPLKTYCENVYFLKITFTAMICTLCFLAFELLWCRIKYQNC